MNFMFLENEIKVCSIFYKKNYFCILESLFDDKQKERLCRILLRLSNVFNIKLYFIHQIRSICMISMFIINK